MDDDAMNVGPQRQQRLSAHRARFETDLEVRWGTPERQIGFCCMCIFISLTCSLNSLMWNVTNVRPMDGSSCSA